MDKIDNRKAAAEAASTIGGSVVITGDVECAGELQISGRVNGDVRCGTLFVDEGGAVKGTVQAERVRISGMIDGDVDTGDLAIEATGQALGTLTYARLKVIAGGVIEGSLRHRQTEPVAQGEPERLKLVETTEPAATAAAAAAPRRVYVD